MEFKNYSSFKWLYFCCFFLISLTGFSQTGDQYANVQYTDDLENGDGKISIYIYVENEYDGHWDYLRNMDIDVSVDGGDYTQFGFLGLQNQGGFHANINALLFHPNSYSDVYANRGIEYVLNTGSNVPNQYMRLYFTNQDNEVGDYVVTSHFEDTNSQVAGTTGGADRIRIDIYPHHIERFKNAKNIRFRTRGEYLENFFDYDSWDYYPSEHKKIVNEKETGVYDISLDTQPNLGNEEVRVSFENNNVNTSGGNVTLGVNLEYFDHLENYDHIDELDIDYSIDNGATWVGFAYVRHNSLNTSSNPWSYVVDLNDTSKNKDPYKLFFANYDNELNDGLVTYTITDANHAVNEGLTNLSNRLNITIPVKEIPRLKDNYTIKWRVRGVYRDVYNGEVANVDVLEELSDNYAITEENKNGQDEIDFNATYNANEGCAILTFRLEKREGESNYDHLACLELGKQREGQADETIGHFNHNAGILGCGVSFTPDHTHNVVGKGGDTYTFSLKNSNLKVQESYLTLNSGEGNQWHPFSVEGDDDLYVTVKDYISQEEFDTNIKYYVHGSYYERDLNGEGNKATFNWNNNVEGDFTASSVMNIATIDINSAEVSGTSNCQIDITWDTPAVFGGLVDNNYVGIYRNNELIAHVDADGGVDEYHDTDVVAGVTYNYQLALVYGRSFDTNLEGQKSSSRPAKIELLEAPSGLASSQTGCDGSIDVTWSYATNPEGFIVERKTENTGFVTLGGIIDGSIRAYTDTNDIVENEVYYYRISAIANELSCNAQGEFSAVLTHSKDPIDVKPIFNSSDYGVEISKGYFSNRTELEWFPNLNTEQYINQYKIYTRELGSTTKPKLITTLDVNAKRYDHTDGKAGTIYEYFIVGERVVETACGRQVTSSYTIDGLTGIPTPINLEEGVAYDVGLRVATGVINGNIVYQGGIAVPNVKVVAERQDDTVGKSLYFNGTNAYMQAPYNDKFISEDGNMTLSAWIKPENLNQFSVVIEKQSSYGVHVAVDGSTYFYIKDQNGTEHTVTAPAGSFKAGNWTNLTGTLNVETQELAIYINGELKGTNTLSGVTGIGNNTDVPFVIGRQHVSEAYYFQGNVDEIRLYNRTLTADEVAKESSKLIASDVDGLASYWKVFEGAGTKVYDLAHEGDDFYKNDGDLLNVLFTEDTPTQTQLGNVGYTDAYGNYTIEAVEYGGVGENFNIIPTATLAGAVHEFDPGRKTLFIGEGSKVNNDKDFEDISSFQFSGYVKFDFEEEEGNGVKSSGSEGVRMYLDGTIAITGDDNKVYETGEDGFFDVQIPIGHHFVEFRKNQHTFSNERFPAGSTYDFQEGITGLEIWDTTTLILSGKIAGGTAEAAKNLAMPHEPGVNNIGTGTFTITSEDNKVVRTIVSDPVTGEYTINLPPKKYTSSSVEYTGNDTGGNPVSGTIIASEAINPLDLSTINAYNGVYETDSVFVEGAFVNIDSTFYNLRKDFIKRATPELIVTAEDGGSLMTSGEETYALDQGDEIPEIDLTSLQFPVYISAADYAYKMKAVERYINVNTGTEDVVAVTDGEVAINNAIGQGYYMEDGKKVPYGNGVEQIPLDENGELLYLFKAREPNTTRNLSVGQEHLSFTKQMSVNLTIGSTTTAWDNPLNSGQPFRAYVFGGVPTNSGNSFVTESPAVVDYILRDPGGSNSYAYWTKGHTNTTSQEFYVGGFANLNAHVGIGAGSNTLVGGGIAGVGETSKMKALATLDVNVSSEIGGGGEFIQTSTFEQTITTNADPIQIGRSDVFVATSKNLAVSSSMHIRPVPIEECGGQCYGDIMTDGEGNQYRMSGINEMAVSPKGTPTYFIYSENHIVNVLIPDLEGVRNTYLTSNAAYTSKLAPDHANYGTSNDDPVWGANASTTNYVRTEEGDEDGMSYTFNNGGDDTLVDEVRKINTQIRLWKEALATNEIEKWLAGQNETPQNISISGGNTLEKSETSSDSKAGYFAYEVSASVGVGFNFEYNGWGLGVETKLNAEIGVKSNGKFGGGTETTKTTGYVLADSDEDDFISIDVYKGSGNNGAIFKTIGGQTSCPFEDKVVMKYVSMPYLNSLIDAITNDKNHLSIQPNKASEKLAVEENLDNLVALRTALQGGEVVLSNATIQRDKPQILINGAKTAQAFNIPADEAANFDLTLNNLSESGDAMLYAVQALDETNPNGLEMTIDGQSINSSREFLVQGGGGINKVLKVRRGPNHYDYEDVGIIIKSTCQFDPTGNDAVISDTIHFAAKFLPVCTPLEIRTPSNNWTLNNSFNDIQPITVAGYDVNTVGFEEIKIQYKESAASDWILLTTYYKDEIVREDKGGAEEDPLLPTTGNSMTYNWDVGLLPDGNYDIRALSGCALADSETEIYSGIVDRTNPQPFGAPQPSDGILSAGEEASIQFTETINSNLLSVANFDVRGVLNGAEIRHNASIAFDGSTNTYAKATNVNLENKPFTIEFYAKKNIANADQILLAQGSDVATEMLFGVNSSNRFYFSLAGRQVTGVQTIDNNWHHYAVTYSPLNADVTLYIDGVMDVTDNSFVVLNKLKEDLYFGKSAIGTSNPLNGNIHEVRIWSKALTLGQVNLAATKRMVGNEAGLLYNWEFEEANGDLALDKVRGKHAEMNANWAVDLAGYGLRLDAATNQAETQSVAFDNLSDFTFEFWFKSDGGTNETLLSNGKGDGTDDNTSGWSVSINNLGKVAVQSNGNTLEGATVVTDNKWHHVAVVVNARGNAVLFIDANEENAIDTAQLNGFGGSKITLGKRIWYEGITEHTDQKFTGNLDELRIWNTARKAKQIERDRFNNLSGNEPGLVEYYPFETFTVNGFGITEVTQNENNTSVSNSKATQNVVLSGASFTQTVPVIKLKRPVEVVNVSYAVNNDKVIINLNVEASKIENVQLDFTVSNVKDLNGNVIPSPITWSAYVDKNQVVWQESIFNLETENGEELRFESQIFNNSGESKTFEITNVPSWLTVTPTSGTVGPLTTVPVSFVVSDETNNGRYQEDVLLTTDFGFAEKLNVNVAVKQAPPSNWFVDPTSYEYSMNVVGQLSFNGVVSRDEGNILAAFVGDECRGLVNLRHISTFDNYQAFLSIYSNETSGETLEFKIWEASTGIIHSGITHDLIGATFNGDTFEGSSANPKLFSTTNIIAGAIEVPSGWKWISFNLEGTDLNTTNTLLGNLNPETDDVIKTRVNVSDGEGGFVQNAIFDKFEASVPTWYGSITNNGAFDTGVLYKIKVSNAGTIRYEGAPVNQINHELNLVEGWNYIGYTGNQKIEINEGLSNYEATDGDLIKNQYYSAVYDASYGWIGSLTMLSPNDGYMLKTAVSQSFKYPVFNSSAGAKSSTTQKVYESKKGPWESKTNQFAENMTIIAQVNEDTDGYLGAFVEGECRGYVLPVHNPVSGEKVYIVTLGGEAQEEEVTFKYIASGRDEVVAETESIKFSENSIKGTLEKPFEINLANDEQVKEDTTSLLQVYPNPFREHTSLNLNLSETSEVRVVLYDSSSRLIKLDQLGELQEGNHTVNLNYSNLATGIYHLKIAVNDKIYIKKIIVLGSN